MLTHVLPLDTQAILLLCASFGQHRQTFPQPLTLNEYNTLANWLRSENMTPEDLLKLTVKNRLPQITIGNLNSNRLTALLERGMMLSLAVEKWTNQGLWVLGRGDTQYPKRLKQKLRHLAPPVLYGVGSSKLLSQGGLAVVGSRDIDEEGLDYTVSVVQTCAEQDIQIVSGGARGVDRASMLGALEAGGTAVGVLASYLAKEAVSGKYRQSIKAEKLALISPYDPDAGFSIGNAMGRNKCIYALADYAVVISASVEKGGTWTGAVEALERIRDIPVLVRTQGAISEGNRRLVEKGAKPFPKSPWEKPLKELLAAAITEVKPSELVNLDRMDRQTQPLHDYPEDIYNVVLPLILHYLEQPKGAKSLAQFLKVRPVQMQDWLDRAVEEGKVKKNKKPVTYEVEQNKNLLELLP